MAITDIKDDGAPAPDLRPNQAPVQPALLDAAVGETGTWQILKRLFANYIRPHLGRLAIAIMFMIMAAGTEGATAWLLDPAIDYLFLDKREDMLILIPLAIIGVMVLKAVASYGQDVMMNYIGQRIIADTQIRMFDKIMRADMGWLNRVHTGHLIARLLNDVAMLRESVSRAITGIARDALKVVALGAVMFYQDWQLALIALIVFPLAGLFIRQVGKLMRKASTLGQQETGVLTTLLSETLDGTRIIKAYGQEKHEVGRISDSVERRLKHIMKAVRVRSASGPITEVLTGITIAGVIFYAGWKAQTGEMELNHFVSFLGAMMLAYRPLRSLATFNAALQEGLAAAVRIFAVLDVESRISDADDAKPLKDGPGAVRFNGVRFEYDDGTPALHGVTLDLPAGKTVALVGPSGSGKSTILNLIPRFYDVSEGEITIDGQDVRHVTQDSLREKMALVTQEPFLFDDSIAANIAYGSPDASMDDVIEAAEAAAAHDFVSDMPEGYHTVVGESGVRLSGGQRQRIAIARAFLRNAPILLLDEATSALDTESERKVQAALNKLMVGRTTLVIAHRLSTVMDADIIYVIKDGIVAEQGRHDELVAMNGVYTGLYQNLGEEG